MVIIVLVMYLIVQVDYTVVIIRDVSGQVLIGSVGGDVLF